MACAGKSLGQGDSGVTVDEGRVEEVVPAQLSHSS